MKTKTSYFLTCLFTITCLLLCVKMVVGQNTQIKRTNNWYFGDKAGINFNGGTATAVTDGQMSVYSGCATMSDTLGNLLMYTDGQTVWNKNHQIMPNGTNLYGVGTPVQSSIILPKPLDDNLYYIFTCAGNDGIQYGIRYSIVDITSDNGLGDILLKNELLFAPSTEQLAATMHKNCIDVWIMAHERESNIFRAYLLTANGIDTNAIVINNIGKLPDLPNTDGLQLKFSHNGKKMVSINFWDNLNYPSIMDTIELYDFDNLSGLLSNRITLYDSACTGVVFSPDDSKLYTGGGGLYDAFSFQWDLSSNIENIIRQSRTIIYYDEYYNQTDFQLTPQGKIIAAISYKDTISIIENPNSLGISCNLIVDGIDLNGSTCYGSLPNFISSYFNQDSSGCFFIAETKEIHDKQVSIHVYPNPFSISTNIVLKFPTGNVKECEIILYDLFGRNITASTLLNEFKHLEHETIFTLHKNNISSGIYFLNIRINHKSYTQKLIIN